MSSYIGLGEPGFRSNPTAFSTPKLLFVLLLGIALGFIIAVAWTFTSQSDSAGTLIGHTDVLPENTTLVPLTNATESTDYEVDEVHAIESKDLANRLFAEIRVLCWVMTTQARHSGIAKNIHFWGKRCNKVIFMTDSEDPNFNDTVILPTDNNRAKPWGKTKEALAYLHKHHIDDADWFLRVDDTSFVIMENLRYMLSSYPREYPIYISSNFAIPLKEETKINWIGSNFVLSNQALRNIAEKGLNDTAKCEADNTQQVDDALEMCVARSGVKLLSSTDEYGHERFLALITDIQPFPLCTNMTDRYWYWQYLFHLTQDEITYPSDMAISFQCVRPNDMIVMDYLIYHLRTYGLITKTPPLPPKLTQQDFDDIAVTQLMNDDEFLVYIELSKSQRYAHGRLTGKLNDSAITV